MVTGEARRKGGRNGGSEQEVANIDTAMAKRRRIAAAIRVGVRTKVMLASVVGVALVAAFGGGGEC